MLKFTFTLFALILIAGCSTTPTSNESFRLRVMTYNIHHGEGTDGKIDLERIAKLITDNKVDLVALQEVDKNTQRTGHRDMPAELSRLTGMTNIFGPNIDLQGGHYGNAILSRFPIISSTNHHLPQIVPGEQRGLLQATIRLPVGNLTFCSVHLDHRRPEADRLASVNKIKSILEVVKSPLVLVAGDFNARPDSETYKVMDQNGYSDSWKRAGQQDGFTIPSEKPTSRIDYIWTRTQNGLRPENLRVIPSNASDHLPLLSEFGFLIIDACEPETPMPDPYNLRRAAH